LTPGLYLCSNSASSLVSFAIDSKVCLCAWYILHVQNHINYLFIL
jgi:hypothetical protein